MAKKVTPTKTLNPLHFEDLDPHRFEDLVRRLLYGFRDWSNIEPTGRGGSDDGFDARAWEKADSVTNVSDEGEEGERTLDGRLWQVQAKREKTITPSDIRRIVDGVDDAHPPYGYILAAATNISKPAYDAFREELRKKGVRELYFWGKDYLEDQLALPQNDDILFTFFSVSLSPRRRSRMSEIKFNINNKNKIQRILFGSDTPSRDVSQRQVHFLLRDIKDKHYPDVTGYDDFETRRRWEEHDAVHISARGVFFKAREWYGYLDEKKKTWDYTRAVDLTARELPLDETNRIRFEDDGRQVEHFWRHLPLACQAKLDLWGFVAFEDMLLIDEKGDSAHPEPHIFIDFGERGPFEFIIGRLYNSHALVNDKEREEEYRKVSIFPTTFPKPKVGKTHEIGRLGVPQVIGARLQNLHGATMLHLFGAQSKEVLVDDLIKVPTTQPHGFDNHAIVTAVRTLTVGAFLKESDGSEQQYREHLLKESAGRDVKKTEKVTVVELFSILSPPAGDSIQYFGR